MYGVTLILILATVGGVIAYIGDRLGMNVGKKRLTLFGLRPRYTSILVTIVTGVLIATASIGVLSIASLDVRTALFRMKEIQQELRHLQTDYLEMRVQRDQANRELQVAETRVQEALENYEEVLVALAEAETEMETQKLAIEDNEEAIRRMVSQIEVLQQEAVDLVERTQELRENYLQVATAFDLIRETNLAFNASEVISTTVVKKGLNRTDIYRQLERFLKEVDDVAYRRSARSAAGDNYRAIYLTDGVLDFAVEDILFAKGDVIVRAVSESNTIPGVPVVVYLENYPDQMIFSKGTVLADGVWDPKSGVEIDRVILQILNQANNLALDAGLALSPGGAAVLLPGDLFLEAIFASRNIEEPVTVQLIVGEDAWRSTSPVQVHLEIVS